MSDETQKFERDVKFDNSLSRGSRALTDLLFSVMRGEIFRSVQLSQSWLAARLGRSVRTVGRYVAELVAAGVLVAEVQRSKVSGEWVNLPSKYRFVARASRAVARVKAVMRHAEHVRKAVAAKLARRSIALSDIFGRRVAPRGLKGEARASLSLFERQQVAAKYSQEDWEAIMALPDGG